jgi:hypothetical protein
MPSGHRLAEARSIALHRAVAERLRADPALMESARGRVRVWRAEGKMHPRYAEAWEQVLARPLDEVCAFLIDPGEEACALRQSTPFTGVLDARTRWRIWREVRAAP